MSKPAYQPRHGRAAGAEADFVAARIKGGLTRRLAASALWRVLLVVLCTAALISSAATAYASFSSKSLSGGSADWTSSFSGAAADEADAVSVEIDGSTKFRMGDDAKVSTKAIARLSKPVDRSGVVEAVEAEVRKSEEEAAAKAQRAADAKKAQEAASSEDGAGQSSSASNPSGSASGSSQGSSSDKFYAADSGYNQASFYEWNCNNYELGVAVDIGMLDKYPKGTVFELSYNGRTCLATVNDCGFWQTNGGNYYRMFDLQTATCDALGWDYKTRHYQGVIDVSWRVVSYG